MIGPALAAIGAVSAGKSLYEQFKTPGQRGRDARAMADAAYPGTTPWEQLGAGGGGAMSAAASDRSQSVQRAAMAAAERQNQRVVAAQLRGQEVSAVSQMLGEILRDQPGYLGNAMSVMSQLLGRDVPAPSSGGRIRFGAEGGGPPESRIQLHARQVAQQVATARAQERRHDVESLVSVLRQQLAEDREPWERRRALTTGFLAREAQGVVASLPRQWQDEIWKETRGRTGRLFTGEELQEMVRRIRRRVGDADR